MKLIVDVAYHEVHAVAAGIGFQAWTDEVASFAKAVTSPLEADYEPGAFYKRELPPIRALLRRVPFRPALIVIDAYVDLGPDRPGLGRRLHEETAIPVIGVAKTPFPGAPAVEILRGSSARPLFVTAAGVDTAEAAELVRGMHGPSRLPTLIGAADRLAGHG